MAEKMRDDTMDLAMTQDLSFIASIMMTENSAFEGRFLRYIVANLIGIAAVFFSIIFKSMIVWIPALLLTLGIIIWYCVALSRARNRQIEMAVLRKEAKEYFLMRLRQLEAKDVGCEEVVLESRRRVLESLKVFLRIAESTEFRE
jgi:hypothetical protein